MPGRGAQSPARDPISVEGARTGRTDLETPPAQLGNGATGDGFCHRAPTRIAGTNEEEMEFSVHFRGGLHESLG